MKLLRANGGRAAAEAVGDPELARKRLERWRAIFPDDDGVLFARRLEAEGLSQDELLILLGSPVESLSESLSPPGWLAEIEQAYSTDRPGPPAETLFTTGLAPEQDPWQIDGLLKGLGRLVARGAAPLQEGIDALALAYPSPPFDPRTVASVFLSHLPAQLLTKTSRVVVLELNVARLSGTLQGETPEDRYNDFRRRLSDPSYLVTLLHEYPVLSRQLVRTIKYWSRNSLEVLTRLCADWDEITQVYFGGADPGPVVNLSAAAGDAHREARSVHILTFESGERLVYKPHSLSVDGHFGELLGWLNDLGAPAAFRRLRVLDKGEYGWAEFVPPHGCSTDEEVRRFYLRQGGLLALLYALEATDFHLENLIASGEHPVLVDLEALFHPRLRRPSRESSGFSPAAKAMEYSVLRIGLLPQRIWAAGGSEGVDMSGLGGAPGQMTPFPVATFEKPATDEMHVVRKRVPMSGSQNRPSLGGGEVRLADYLGEVVAGFGAVYRLLLQNQEVLLSEDGPLASFAGDQVRAVLRATRTYGELLNESYHPDVLRDALTRDRLFERLWLVAGHTPAMLPLIPYEREDVLRGDIPFFSSRPNSRDVWTSRGERIPDLFEGTSLEAVRQRVQALNEDDLARQTWFITASISSTTLGLDRGSFVGSELRAAESGAERGELLAAARAVADRLEQLAIRDETHVNWIGLTFLGQKNWTLLPLPADMYNGTMGVALFLAYAGDLLAEQRYTGLARTIIDGVLRGVERARREGNDAPLLAEGPGGFSGAANLIHVLSHLGALWGDRSLYAAAESLVEYLPPLIEKDESLDVIGGSAGCVLNLLSLYRCNGSEAALAAAVRCGERLVERARPAARGVGWETPMMGEQPLTGISHGAAGMACALLELWAETDRECFRETALRAFEYERSVFSPEEGNWPDFRPEEGEPRAPGAPQFMTTWCHGAPGIGLSRVRALSHLDDDELRKEIRVALVTTLRKGFGLNHSLCHGDLGNLDFLLEAALALGDDELLGQVYKFAASILGSIRQYGWLCGTPGAAETPGLMTGLAGIGYELLRLAEPGRVPSVLALDAPSLAGRPRPARAAYEVA